jgi:hypothetical protein
VAAQVRYKCICPSQHITFDSINRKKPRIAALNDIKRALGQFLLRTSDRAIADVRPGARASHG